MTDEQKTELRKGVDKIADSMYESMLQSYELVEKEMPSFLSDVQKQQIFTAIFQTCFDTQTQLLQRTMADTKQKVQDKDLINKMSKEL